MYIVYIQKNNKDFKIIMKEWEENFLDDNIIYCEYHLSENIAKKRREILKKLSKNELKKLKDFDLYKPIKK